MIVVISCGASKLPGRHQARNLYTGGYFKQAYAWATSVVEPQNVYILSAKYGLVNALEEIDTYDLTLGQPGAIGVSEVHAQALSKGLLAQQVVVVGGTRYVKMARQIWPECQAPFGKDGGLLAKNGIGYQMSALKSWRGRIPGRT